MADRPPLFFRRLRAALGRLVPRGQDSIQGFVDGCVAGEIRGWAMDPRRPNRRVHVVAVSEGQVIAEALADISRSDLVQEGRGDGRYAFRLRLPAALLDGAPRQVQVQAIRGGAPVRLLRGDIEISPSSPAQADGAGGARTGPAAGPRVAIVEQAPSPFSIALWPGEGGNSEPPADWGALGRSGGRLVRLGQPGVRIEHLAEAHTVLFARPGDQIDPIAAVLLQRSRPLSDVLTWDGASEASRRPEARALGLLLGETLGGTFALRGHVFRLMGEGFARALVAGDRRRAELLLAARPELRWAHLAGRIVSGPADGSGIAAASSEALPGFRWTEADGARAGRLVPDARPGRITLALWPQWGAGAEASLRALLGQTVFGAAIEVLVPAAAVERARALTGALGLDHEAGMSVRAVDAPSPATPGGWLAAMSAAASGEILIVCQAGVTLHDQAGALEEILAWASSPLVGAVTAPISRKSRAPLAGLALERSAEGWSARSAHASAQDGLRRPVVAAPASFLAIGRDKLAGLGGAAAARLPAGGVDIDLCLRLRRLGLAAVLLGDLGCELPGGVPPAGEITGAPLAAFDPEELAAAAAAYPAPKD